MRSSINKVRYLYRCLKATLSMSATAVAVVGFPLGIVRAQTVLPQGGSVVSGQAKISAPSANTLAVMQTSNRAIIDWNSFSVGPNGAVDFIQPGSTSAILNRVTGSTASTIAGQVTANGQVFLVNPNGIAITSSGSVQVGGGFVGSTLDIGNADFNAGRLAFSGNGTSAHVSNAGAISSAGGGFVGLIGGSVANSGVINVPLGKVGLGSGERITLDPTGDGFLQVAVPTGATAPDGRALVDVAGRIRASGGSISIGAATAQQFVRDAVNVSGVLSARSVSGSPGKILLSGGAGGNVTVSGKLSARGGRRHTGGTVVVTGENTRLTSSAKLDVSGSTGGTVLVGGDLRGGQDLSSKLVPQTVPTARTTIVDEGATITANGTAGAGGNVVIWSDVATGFRGTISATGNGGDGGAVEVSSHEVLGYGGLVDVRSSTGKTGDLLLDPYNVTISSAPDTNISLLSSIFTLLGNDSNISLTTLTNALASANVTISTGLLGFQQGDITVASGLTLSSGNVLTLSAANDIAINAPITGSNGSGLTLTAGRDVVVNSNIASSTSALNVNITAATGGAGTIAVNGATIDTNGGSLTMSASQNGANTAISLNGATLDVGGGNASLAASSASGTAIKLSGTNSFSSGGAGTVALAGTSTSGDGMQFDPGSSLLTSGNTTLSGVSSGGNGVRLGAGSSLSATSGNLTLTGSSSSSLGLNLLASSSVANTGSGILALTGTGGANLGGSIISTAGTLSISGSGNVNQSGGVITASNILLSGGSGNFILNSAGNQIGTIAAAAASLSLTSNSALAVGSVSGTPGITTSGNVSLVTAGDLTLAPGATISGASPILAAAGNFVNNAGSAAVTATSGRWLVYSNAPAGDIFGGLNSANTAIWNATYASLAPGSVSAAGNRYLFAFQPTLTFASANAAKTYGADAAGAIASNFTVSGLQSGVTNAFVGDTAAGVFGGTPILTSLGAVATANVIGSPYAINVALGSLTSLANYLFAFQSSGQLTVNPAPVIVTALGGSSVYGSSPSNPGLLVTGLQNDQTASALTGLYNTFGINGLSPIGTYSLNVAGSLTNPNYAVVGTNIGIWQVTPLRGSLTGGSSLVLPGLSVSTGLSLTLPAAGTNGGVLTGLVDLSGGVNIGAGLGTSNGGSGPTLPIVPAVLRAPDRPAAGNAGGSGVTPGTPAQVAPLTPLPGTPPVTTAPLTVANPFSQPHASCGGGNANGQMSDCTRGSPTNEPKTPDSIFQDLNRTALFKALDRELSELRKSNVITPATLAKFAAGASIAITIGIMGWLLRGGAVLGALLSSMPLWLEYDPLLVLRRPIKSNGEDEPTSEVEHIFDNAKRAFRAKRGLAQ